MTDMDILSQQQFESIYSHSFMVFILPFIDDLFCSLWKKFYSINYLEMRKI